MNTLAGLLIAISTLPTTCIVYDSSYRADGPRGDRDNDGVPNRTDRHPHDPYGY